MRKVGDIFSLDNFGEKAYYKVLKVNEDGSCVCELQIGYVPSTSVEDLIETVKEASAVAKKVTTKKTATTSTSKPTTAKKKK